MLRALPFLIALVFLAAPAAGAQDFDAANLRRPAPLGGPWLVQPGDDPAYAQTGFDDSHWLRFDANQSVKTVLPDSRPEVLWYRMHIKVAPNDTGLALEEWNIASASLPMGRLRHSWPTPTAPACSGPSPPIRSPQARW
jgi:hypothetical protein